MAVPLMVRASQKRKRRRAPKGMAAAFSMYLKISLGNLMYPFVLKKTRARYCTPIFGFPESPLYTGVSALSVCPFCVAGFCPFCVAGFFYRNPFVYRGFTCFYPQKKFALFVSLEKLREIPLNKGVSNDLPPKKSLPFLCRWKLSIVQKAEFPLFIVC